MSHHNGALIAITREPNPSPFQKTLALTDFYRNGPGSELPLGSVQLMGRSTPAELGALLRDVLPTLSPEQAAANSIDFWLTAEDLPVADNRVTLGRDGAIKLTHRLTNIAAYEALERALRGVLERVIGPELVFTGYRLDVSGVSHQCGTLRFGVDPESSMLDLTCRAHQLDNLYVVDASFFPASGAVNPSLTIMANALRVGDHLIDRLHGRWLAATRRPVTVTRMDGRSPSSFRSMTTRYPSLGVSRARSRSREISSSRSLPTRAGTGPGRSVDRRDCGRTRVAARHPGRPHPGKRCLRRDLVSAL